jgi:mono/diheme cytochrome c family protein
MVLLLACVSPPASTGNPDLEAGRDVYARVCAVCHGSQGGGVSAPTLAGVVETFPDCTVHQQWITLGSDRWRDEVSATYGAQNKEITAVMPSWESSLTELEIKQVAAFERSQFGGQDGEAARSGCGLGGG